MSHIFISYSREDVKSEDGIVQRLITQLRRNFHIWLDQSDIIPGTNWQDAIQTAVKNSSVMVFILSPQSATSDWCKAEINAAKASKVPIIPYVYQEADFPFGMSETNAVFHSQNTHALETLEEAIKKLAPQTSVYQEAIVVTNNLLNNSKMTFQEATAEVRTYKTFYVNLDAEIELIGLPLLSTSFCTAYLVGRADDKMNYQFNIQVALQFSGQYESDDFPVRIAKHFLKEDPKAHLRMLLVRGPAKITYNQHTKTNSLSYILDRPTEEENQWKDAVNTIQNSIKLCHKGHENPQLHIFVQGPVAGITYALGANYRDLQYKVQHYQYDRDAQEYFNVQL
ncbi:toll/interleukin-1 receptor domain-containing protein [Phototrophicus methaneseepsis]|uniref:Toll/interleukin-1 receptor domain-containing protein n=1 Tax=Phototrophicus methaneseepsis TaxID=2710758 RepID=A0A7S8E531_9CHLR|nr:toll/interleukin-1 receptor domain-containing protein [Phototrophicus methaneseepsis]QPC80537.1 toll/interleukin-1 receptor domain-containing protein [Phototrophicus methaneseepsis]